MVSAPKAPDPVLTAQAQGTINRQTAQSQQLLNSMNQTTPDGSLTYSENGAWSDGTPKIGVTQTLSPTNQQLYNIGQGTQLNLASIGNQQSGQIGSLLATPFDMSQGAIDGQTAGMPALPQYRQPQSYLTDASGYATNPNAPGARYSDASAPAARYTDAGMVGPQYSDPTMVGVQYSSTQAPDARYTDATGPAVRQIVDPTLVSRQDIGSNDQLTSDLYSSAFQRYQPQLDQQRQGMEADLANRGLRPGSTASDNAVQGYNNSVNDLRSTTFLNGQNQAFNQSATRANTAFSQDLSRYGQYFDESAKKADQEFNQDLASRGFTANVNNQNFSQDMARAGYTRDTNNANFQQALGVAGNARATNDSNFQQALASGQFAMSANKQNYDMDLSNLGYTAGINNQNFTQDMARAGYTQGVNAQNYGQESNANNQNFTQGMALAQFGAAQDQYNYQAAMSQRQQALSELLQNRTEPLNEIASLMGGSQVSKPSWTATPTATIQPANLEGLVQSNYQQQMQSYNGMLGGLASLGGTAAKGLFSLSDARAKQDVKQIARLPNGLGVYSYRFADGRHEIGLLAQEVVLLAPSAIMHRDDGLMAVDYARALEAA